MSGEVRAFLDASGADYCGRTAAQKSSPGLTRITDQNDRPVSVPNLNGPEIPWLLGGPIHGLLVGWTLDLPASADVLIRIDKEKAVSRHDLPPTLFNCAGRRIRHSRPVQFATPGHGHRAVR
jgi:hypothetical protein